MMIIIIFYDNSAPLKIQQSFTPDILSSTPFELLPYTEPYDSTLRSNGHCEQQRSEAVGAQEELFLQKLQLSIQ
jgi:hypothetical protein